MPYSLSEKERKRTREQEREPLDCHTEAQKWGFFLSSFIVCLHIHLEMEMERRGVRRQKESKRKKLQQRSYSTFQLHVLIYAHVRQNGHNML